MKKEHVLIDVAIPGDRNVIQKEAEKILKYKDLTIEIQHMWNVKTASIHLLLLLLLSSSSLSPLCRVFIHIFLRQTMSLRNTMLQLFCRCCLWCPYH
jgi:hypothetical protein